MLYSYSYPVIILVLIRFSQHLLQAQYSCPETFILLSTQNYKYGLKYLLPVVRLNI